MPGLDALSAARSGRSSRELSPPRREASREAVGAGLEEMMRAAEAADAGLSTAGWSQRGDDAPGGAVQLPGGASPAGSFKSRRRDQTQ